MEIEKIIPAPFPTEKLNGRETSSQKRKRTYPERFLKAISGVNKELLGEYDAQENYDRCR